MTTFVDFAPSAVASPPFSFQATLDQQTYNVAVTWNIFGQRWYVTITALDGTVILNTALVSSPTGIAIENLTWSEGEATAMTAVPHGFRIGSIVTLTVAGADQAGYNGTFACLITGPSTFTYPVTTNPGIASVFGTAQQNVNLVGGVPDENGDYFTSTLVFRDESQQFEISP